MSFDNGLFVLSGADLIDTTHAFSHRHSQSGIVLPYPVWRSTLSYLLFCWWRGIFSACNMHGRAYRHSVRFLWQRRLKRTRVLLLDTALDSVYGIFAAHVDGDSVVVSSDGGGEVEADGLAIGSGSLCSSPARVCVFRKPANQRTIDASLILAERGSHHHQILESWISVMHFS